MNVTVAEPRTPHNPHNNNIVSREPERQLGLRAFSLIDGRGEGDKPLPFFAVVRDTRVPGNATTYAVWMQIGERCQSEDHWWPLSLDEIADGARCSPRSVSTHTKLLEENGLLEVRHHHNGRKNQYRVHPVSSANPADLLSKSCRAAQQMLLPEEEREQLRGSFSSGSDPLSKDVANIGAATPPNPPQKKSGSNRSPISFSKSTLLFLKLYRKLSKGRGEKINEVGLLARARTFEADIYAEKKAILDRLTAEEKLLTAKGVDPRIPQTLGGPGAVRQRPSPNGDIGRIVGSVAKSMPSTFDDFGETAPKVPWRATTPSDNLLSRQRALPDCTEHRWTPPARDGISTCVVCNREERKLNE